MIGFIRQIGGVIALTVVLLAHIPLTLIALLRPRGADRRGAIHRVLFVAPFPPGEESGGAKAVLDLITTLRPRYDVRVHAVAKAPPAGALSRLAQSLLRPLPIPPHCRSLMFGDAAVTRAAQGADAVLFEFLLTGAFLYFGRLEGQQVVIRDHEVLVRKLDMERRRTRGLESFNWLLRTLVCYLFSLVVYRRADRIVTLTEADADAIRRWFPFYAQRVCHIPAPFEAPQASAPATPSTPTRDLMMVANFFHSPNRDGLLWFLRECAPHLPAGYTLHLCGLDGALREEEMQSAHLRIVRHGFVEDHARLSQLAPIAVAPIVSGGGVRIKNLFLGSLGKALVTTPLGNEGIDFEDGVHAIICGSGQSMAERISAASANPAYVAQLGAAAQAHIRTRFRSDAIRDQFTALFESLSRTSPA